MIFDTYGDAVGALYAVWAAAVMFLVGCLVSVVYVIAVKREPPKAITHRASEMVNRKNISDIIFTKSLLHQQSLTRFSDMSFRNTEGKSSFSGRDSKNNGSEKEELEMNVHSEPNVNNKNGHTVNGSRALPAIPADVELSVVQHAGAVQEASNGAADDDSEV